MKKEVDDGEESVEDLQLKMTRIETLKYQTHCTIRELVMPDDAKYYYLRTAKYI